MAESSELHTKIMGFLSGEFARKDGRQCVGVDLLYAPGNGFRDEEIRKWSRVDEPEMFDNFVHVEKLVSMILEIAEGEVDAKPAGKHRFVVRTHQHLGGRALQSFSMAPTYHGGEEMALTTGTGPGSRQDVIANHAGQLMRINAQMFEGTIRVLGQQNMSLHQQVSTLTSENATLRSELEEARSNKMDREFQVAMAVEKNARTNAGFEQLLRLGSVVAAKIGGGGDEATSGTASPLAMLLGDFGKSLRPDQFGVIMNALDMSQKIMFMEIMNMVMPPSKEAQPSPSLPPSDANGAPTA